MASSTQTPQVIDLCLVSTDVLKKTLQKQWADDAEMRTGVDSLLAQIAEFAPLDADEAGQAQSAQETAGAETSTALAARAQVSDKQQQTVAAAAKSVRISLARLDRMMNTVGELVINRTRMVGRVTELERLVENAELFETAFAGQGRRVPGKIRIQQACFRLVWSAAAAGANAANADERRGRRHFVLVEFSELEMDRYDDVNILSRSMTEISADVNEVLGQLGGFIGRVEGDIDEFTKLAHHLQDEITAARMVPIGTLYSRLSRAVRDAAKSADKLVELELFGSETELDTTSFSRFPTRSCTCCEILSRTVLNSPRIAQPQEKRNRPGNAARVPSRQSHLHRSRRRRAVELTTTACAKRLSNVGSSRRKPRTA